MKISYSILTHNETTTLEKLLKFLVKYKQPQDEIVILDDYSDNEKTKAILDFYVSTENIVFEQRNLLQDFASQKNYLKNMCSGRMYGYKINERGWINYPDWQGRIFRNRPNIRWEKPVHEQLVGFQTYAHLPTEHKYSIIHPKTIERQVEQNKFYNEEISGIRR